MKISLDRRDCPRTTTKQEALGDRKPSPRHLIAQNSYNWRSPAVTKLPQGIPVSGSRCGSAPKSNNLLLGETSHPQKIFHRN